MLPTLLFTVFLLLLQAPSQQPTGPAPATASIGGVVIQLGTSNPISGADVELSRVEGTAKAPMDPAVSTAFSQLLQNGGGSGETPPQLASEVRNAKTDGDGRFVFRDLKEGKYRLVSVKVGGAYNPAEYGQHDPRQRGLSFLLKDGQKISGVQLGMVPTGAISGRVVDSDGEPMGHVSVMALSPQTQDQRRTYNIMQSATTNEQGEYRLFWLPPGRYYVAAKVEDLQKRSIPYDEIPPGTRGINVRAEVPVVTRHTLPSGETVEEAFAVVYNGGVIDPAQARPIEVRPGATFTGADIPMAVGRLRSHHIRGVIVNASGQPANGASVTAIPTQFGATVLMLRGTTDNNGMFDLQGAVPGGYSLFASTVISRDFFANVAAAAIGANPSPIKPEQGYLRLDMGNSDLENVRITTTTGWTLPARITIEGHNAGNDPDMNRLRIVLTRDPDIVGSPPGFMPAPSRQNGTPSPSRAEGQPDGAGLASLLVAPGDYRVSVSGFVTRFYMKSIRLGGADVWNNGLHLVSAPENTLEIVIGTDAGEVTGILRNDKLELVANAVLALVPQSPLLRYRSASTDADGKFRFPTVPPGAYKIYAWEYADPQQWQDAGFLKQYEFAGKAVEMRPGGKVDLPLQVLPRQ